MTLTTKDIDAHELEYTIDMTAEKGIKIERLVPFKTGESVAFVVYLKSKEDLSLVDIHRQSIERAIEMLQAYLDPR